MEGVISKTKTEDRTAEEFCDMPHSQSVSVCQTQNYSLSAEA